MAEFVGLVASIFTIIEAGNKVTSFIRAAHDAPLELINVSNEINYLTPTLLHIRNIVQEGKCTEDILRTLDTALDQASTQLHGIQHIIDSVNDQGSLPSRRRIVWLRHRHNIAARQKVLQETRLQIMLLLVTQNLRVGNIITTSMANAAAQQAQSHEKTATAQQEIAKQLQNLFQMLYKDIRPVSPADDALVSVHGANDAEPTKQGASYVPLVVGRCKAQCRCHCHTQWNINLRNALFASLRKFSTRSCLSDCSGGGGEARFQFTMFFPRFLLARAFNFYLLVARGTPVLTLTLRPVPPIGFPLFTAAEKNDVGIIRSLIEDGVNPNALSEHGQTAIGFAIFNRHKEAVKFLIQTGADLTVCTGDDVSALHEARQAVITNPADAFCVWLTKLIPGVASLDDLEMSMIHRIVLENSDSDTALLEQTLLACRVDIDRQDAHGRTPLWWAVTRRNVRAVRTLLEHGAAVNKVDTAGYSALLQCIEIGDVAIATELLSHDPDVHQKTRWGRNVLHLAARHSDASILRLLLNANLGIDINNANINGNTPLVIAACYDNHSVAELLVANGADLESIGYFQCTPLVVCIQRKSLRVFEVLLSHGCNLCTYDSEGNNLLAIAAKYKLVKAMDLLSKASLSDVEVDHLNKEGKAAYDYISPDDCVELRDAFTRLVAACRRQGAHGNDVDDAFFDALEVQDYS